jgi:hypothetical protein
MDGLGFDGKPVVYFIGMPRHFPLKEWARWKYFYYEYIKIGFTSRLSKRLIELQVGNPLELDLLAAVLADQSLERCLHDWLKPYSFRGEWYRSAGHVARLLQFCASFGHERKLSYQDVIDNCLDDQLFELTL